MSSDVISGSRTRHSRRDHRKATLAFILVAMLVLGYVINQLPGKGVSADSVMKEQAKEEKEDAFARLQVVTSYDELMPEEKVEEKANTSVPEKQVSPEQVNIGGVLALAQVELDAERYDLAIAALQVAHQQLKQEPQAFLKMGQALEGKKEYEIARDFYNKATDMDPLLAEAYWGFATTSDELGDLESALGAMRNYLHVQPEADPQKLKIVQARSAIWEWESKLGRGPWGPTKGVPPDLTAEQIKRDGRGVATKMPILESKTADGIMKYEIKHADKKEIFKK